MAEGVQVANGRAVEGRGSDQGGIAIRRRADDIRRFASEMVEGLAKDLKNAGWTYDEIGRFFGVTKAQARIYVLGREFVFRGKGDDAA